MGGDLAEPDRRRPGRGRGHALGERGRRDADEAAGGEDVERPRPLADEVRRRREAGVPADAPARKQRDALLADEPSGALGEVASVRVLGNEDRERLLETLVERGDDERERRLRDAGTGRQRLGEGVEPVVLEELPDEHVEDRTVHDERRNRPVPRPRSLVASRGLDAGEVVSLDLR